MTKEQRETIIRQIGVLEGLSCFIDCNGKSIGDALDLVVENLEKVVREGDDARVI